MQYFSKDTEARDTEGMTEGCRVYMSSQASEDSLGARGAASIRSGARRGTLGAKTVARARLRRQQHERCTPEE